MKKKKILVLCTGNSCRSQMAEGYLREFVPNYEIYSAGIEAHGVNPMAIETMMEDGIDIAKQTSNKITEYDGIDFDYIITVCDHAKENCPYLHSHAIRLHKNFSDPAKASGSVSQVQEQFRLVRNEIREYCKNFIKANLT